MRSGSEGRRKEAGGGGEQGRGPGPGAPRHPGGGGGGGSAVILGVVGEPLGFWANFDDRPRGRSLAFDEKGARCSSN